MINYLAEGSANDPSVTSFIPGHKVVSGLLNLFLGDFSGFWGSFLGDLFFHQILDGQFVIAFDYRLRHIHLSACKIAPLAQAPSANLHIVYPPDPQGKPLLRKRLRQGRLQSVSDCRAPGHSKQKPPSGSKALCLSGLRPGLRAGCASAPPFVLEIQPK